MKRTTRLVLIWCVSVSCGIARGQDRPPVSPYQPEPSAAAAVPTNEGAPAPAAYDHAKVIAAVIDAHAKQSEATKKIVDALAAYDPTKVIVTVSANAKRSDVIKEIVDTLEKSGITKSNAPVDLNWMYPGITARIRVQLNTPYEKITALIKAMQYAGVQKFSLTKPGTDGKNILFLVANTPQRSHDIQRIDRAARHAAIENDLELEVITTIPAQVNDDATGLQSAYQVPRESSPYYSSPWAPGMPLLSARPGSPTEIKLPTPVLASPTLDSQQGLKTESPLDLVNPRIDPKALREQIVQQRDQYKSADKRARALAESHRRSPDATKKAELRSAVMSAFLSRQELLQAELLQMQYRLNQTQATLAQRKQICSQIVDRRVLDLLNPQLDWESSKLIDSPKGYQRSAASTRTGIQNSAPNTPTAAARDVSAKTEVEGEWHQVAYSDGEGDSHQKHIYNRTFQGDRSALIWLGGKEENRIEVDSTAKTIRSRSIVGNQGGYSEMHYELQGDRLVIRESGFAEGDRITVYDRGHVPFVKVAPPVRDTR